MHEAGYTGSQEVPGQTSHLNVYSDMWPRNSVNEYMHRQSVNIHNKDLQQFLRILHHAYDGGAGRIRP